MKILSTIALLMIATVTIAWSQNEETRSLSSFDEIRVGESVRAVIKKGGVNEVKIVSNGVSTDKIRTDVESGELYVHMSKGSYSRTSVEVFITYSEELEKVKVSSSANLESKGPIESDELFLKVSSSGRMEVEVQTEQLKIDVSSSGKAIVRGDTQTVVAEASSSGKLDGFDLKCLGAKVDASSSGRIEINVSKEISGQASSSGKVTYLGDPQKVLVETSSSGSVKRG
ncbi:MAG: DUF2807 domain-containing protein [Reichenbachiella sp.]